MEWVTENVVEVILEGSAFDFFEPIVTFDEFGEFVGDLLGYLGV